MHWKVLEN